MNRNLKSAAGNQDAKPALTPKLRFPAFRDADGWEKTTLGEQANILKGKGISKAEIDQSGGQPCIRYGELYTRYGEIIETVFSRTKLPASELFLSRKNDVIIPSSGETKIDIATASCVLCADVALGGDLNVIRSSLNGPFLSYYLNGPKKFDIAKVAQGDTVVHLYPSQLEKIEIAVPAPREQQKIAECLSSVDELIAAQGRKLVALKTHKKGLMQQLFPREGETLPRLRFPEFQAAPEWTELPLSNFFSHMRNGFVGTATPYYEPNGIPYLQGKNIKAGKVDPTNLVTISRAFHEKQKKSQLRVGDVLMVQSGHVGECALVDKDFAGGNCHALIVMSPESRTSSLFFVHYFHAPQGLEKIASVKTGNTIAHILATDLRCMSVGVPKLEEQQRIADCLTSIDDLITAQSAKLSALKTHKKALMQQLFPSPEVS